MQRPTLASLEENIASKLIYLQQWYAEATFDRQNVALFVFVLTRHVLLIFPQYCRTFSKRHTALLVTALSPIPLERLPPRLTLNQVV